MRKTYDIAYKIEVCKRAVDGKEAVSTIAQELDINENTIYAWISRYKENKLKPFVGSGNIKPEDEEIRARK